MLAILVYDPEGGVTDPVSNHLSSGILGIYCVPQVMVGIEVADDEGVGGKAVAQLGN